MAKKRELHGDRPLVPGDEDRLGFSAVAARLASTITDEASRSGFVIGLEGPWGSGKSSLLNLVVGALEAKSGSNRPIVVKFQPWVVGERDGLLTALFSELASAIETSDASPMPDVPDVVTSVAEKVRAFGARLSGVGQLIALADDASLGAIPGLGPVGKIVKSIADTATGLEKKRSLSAAKDDLSDTLNKITRRILVIIDDLDRLEPKEAMELLRLVRAVADFPNVVYLLCYDHGALARNIEMETGVENGAAFLEKIIQVSVGVPHPEEFVLRRWFAEELAKFASPNGDGTARLISTVEVEGGRRLTTPRSVNRVLNAVRLVWPALRNDVDLSDLVWLQLVRQNNPALYQWIEGYCVTMDAVNAEGATIPADVQRHLFEDLEKALLVERQSYADSWHRLGRHLPGIRPPSQGKVPIAERSDNESLKRAIESHRLASPDHSRLYFSLIPSTGAPTKKDFEDLSEAAEKSSQAVEEILRQGLDTKRGPTTKTEVLLERFGGRPSDEASPRAGQNLIIALSNMMDDAARIAGVGQWGRYWIWVTASPALSKLVKKLTPEGRAETLRLAFARGSALGWLTSIWREESRAHEKAAKADVTSEPMLSADELSSITTLLVERFQGSPSEVLAVPNFLQVLFAWAHADSKEAPRRWLEPLIETDEGLVRVLERMSSWVAINDRVRFQISRDNIAPFLNYDIARARIREIVNDEDAPLPLRESARVLLQQFELGEDI